MGFLGRLAKQAATRAIDLALERMLPLELVQSTRRSDRDPQLQKNEPERVVIAQARSPEASPSMSTAYYEKRAQEIVEAQKSAAAVQDQPQEKKPEPAGKLIKLPPRALDGSFKLEQNLGCELPVCAPNRRAVDNETIEVATDDGKVWCLERSVRSKLPAPEHYPYWLWFLDRCQAALSESDGKAPAIKLDPVELFDLFGSPKGGACYAQIDEAFERFSSLLIRHRAAFVMKGKTYEEKANLGTLCFYRSWRAKPDKDQEMFEFAKGCVVPGPVLWSSVQGGYLKSIPLSPIRELGYVGQRLYTYLSKHCQPGGEFIISASKLLPKIPMNCPPDQIKTQLRKHHEQLGKVGFLADVAFDGRGKDLKLTYRRS